MLQPYWNDVLVSAVLFTMSAIGLLVYGIFTFAILSCKELRKNSYYILTLALGYCDCLMLFLFIFYSVPETLGFKIGGLTVNAVMGVLSNFGWFSSLIIIAEIALNRYICVCKHAQVDTWFSSKHIKIMLLFAFTFGCALSAPSFHPCCYCIPLNNSPGLSIVHMDVLILKY